MAALKQLACKHARHVELQTHDITHIYNYSIMAHNVWRSAIYQSLRGSANINFDKSGDSDRWHEPGMWNCRCDKHDIIQKLTTTECMLPIYGGQAISVLQHEGWVTQCCQSVGVCLNTKASKYCVCCRLDG